MARVLADGTGAAWAQVWLVVGDRTTLAATWPPDGRPGARGGRTRDPRTTPCRGDAPRCARAGSCSACSWSRSGSTCR